MVKLSSYSIGYDNGRFEDRPWDFWTEEQKSQVINQAYIKNYLTSAEIKKYLDASYRHMATQYLIPLLSGVAYFGIFRNNLALGLFRRSPYYGILGGVGLVGVTSILWLNLSPFYARKEQLQEQTMDLLYGKVGTFMKMLNDIIPRSRTSGEIDRKTIRVYSERNGTFSGTLYAEEDSAPPILELTPNLKFRNRRHYS